MKFFDKNKKNIIIASFVLLSAFSFFVRYAESATVCMCGSVINGKFVQEGEVPADDGIKDDEEGNKKCHSKCTAAGYKGGISSGSFFNSLNNVDKTLDHPVDATLDALKGPVSDALKQLLIGVLTFVGWLLIIPGVLLDYVLDTKNVTLFLDRGVVKSVWTMVRDFLNIGFIFVLLFSAFATIFQAGDKYHIKNIIFKLILMALLVNFSFPISRFIIDVSNVAMYWMLNNMFTGLSGGGSIAAEIANSSGLKTLLVPGDASSFPIAYLLAAIVFVFILGITLFIIAVMFLIRLIALSVLVMFSPVAFMGYIFPSTAGYASKWWDALFKNAFFAPIMVFGLAIALKIMTEVGQGGMDGFKQAATNNVADGGSPAWIAGAAFFSLPVIVLWMMLGVAQKSSAAGAGAVIGKAKQFSNWVGRKNWGGIRPIASTLGVTGGVSAGVAKFKKNGKLFGVKVPLYGGSDAREAREAKVAGFVSGGTAGYKSAIENRKRKQIADKIEEYKKSGLSASQIEKDLTSNDEVTKIAAAMHMNEKGDLSNINRMQKALAAVGNDVDARNKIIDKISNTAAIFQDVDDYNAVLATALDGVDTTTPDGIEQAKKIRKNFESKFKKDNRMDIILDHDTTYGIHDRSNSDAYGKTAAQIYEDRLGNYSPEDLAKQHNLHRNIATNLHLRDYIRNNIANDPQRHQEMYRHMSTANQTIYASPAVGLNP